ncbi:alpha/beta hydrolase [Nonomuraea guangzhouensis]|uniref:Alpha/beta fold hydrolase n=1 Tax=Nonomuraea guangzhouensis TaxID=1291555 RepID=A0ABW4GGZ0_9ACTN|nr:alpha/beta hydrolase [Nonomuraea guangzhouensis]
MTTASPLTGATRLRRLIVTPILLSVAAAGLACAPGRSGDAATAATGADRTSPAEARRVDQVPAPVLHWTRCRKTAQCATAELPLDYDDPHGATIKLALLRVTAKDPRHRLGSLFVNPGGPGDSARDLAEQVPQVVSKTVLDRFDIVGVDPRGVAGSTQVRCFATKTARTRTVAPLTATPFPGTPAGQRSWIGAAQALGRACSTTGRRIASAMSTTEVARDMDVLRRALGDRELTYLGDSYGSYLGLVYANLFPDRVRAIAIDGVIDPRALAGTPATAAEPLFDRIGAATASYRALRELLERCQRAGRSRCSFADANTPARFDRLAERLRARPLRLAAPGVRAITYTYANLIADTGQWLRRPDGYRGLFAELTDLARLTAPGGAGSGRAAVVRHLLSRHSAVQPGPGADNPLEAASAVLCTDGLHAADAAAWPAYAAAADRRTKYFGAAGAWITARCARNTWTAQDEDVYRGPFDHRTAAPVLVIGNKWDPVTSHDSAVTVARLLPGSRLISSDSWGHTALLTSKCVDNAVYAYLIRPMAPAPKITHCRGDVQPFS